MNRNNGFQSLAFIAMCLISSPLVGQQLSQREQLKIMQDKFDHNPTDQSQRDELIKFAAGMLPQPAISEDARQFYIEGMTLHQDAKSPDDEKIAIQSFQRALAQAPWWGDAYLGLAVSQELSGDMESAIQSLKDYLLSQPALDQARNAQDHIYALKAKLKKIAAAKAAENELQEQKKRLTGYWMCKSGCSSYVPVNSDGSDFHVNLGGFAFDGHFDGDTVTGLVTIPAGLAPNSAICSLPEQKHHMTIYFEDGGKTIRIKYESVMYTVREHKVPDAILGWLSPNSVCDSVTPSETNPQEAELVGGPKKAYVGLTFKTITPEVAAADTSRKQIYDEGFRACRKARGVETGGAVVVGVDPDSPAAAAGIMTGDILSKQKDGGLFCSVDNFSSFMNQTVPIPGQAYSLQFYSNNNKPRTYSITNGARDAF